MDPTVQKVVGDLFAAAQRHDETRTDRLPRWRVLEPGAGKLVWFLARALRARSIVEIGTSRGVSRSGGVLVADNALSHPAEIAPLRELIGADPDLVTTTVDVGNGELPALRT